MKVVLDKPVVKPSRRRRVLRALRWPLISLLILSGLGWGAWTLWNNVRQQVAIGPDFQFDPMKIEIPPLPDWIHTDLKAQVVSDAGWGESLSLLDERLTVRVAQAFQLNPWVAKVQRVSKHQPAGISVDLEYRRPVAMVEVAGGLLAVDAQGTVLPSKDFTKEDARKYPRISGIQTGPRGPVGTRWGDNGVTAAAQLAGYLQGSWAELQLEKIIPHVVAPTDEPERLSFSLVTKKDRMLAWGHLPNHEQAGELSAVEKLARLKQHIATTGDLDQGDPLPDPLSPSQHHTAKLPNAQDR